MDTKKLKNTNRILSIFILILSPFFMYFTSLIFIKDGGSEGFLYLILPFSILANLFIIPAIITLFKDKFSNKFYFFINIIGCVYSIILLTLVI